MNAHATPLWHTGWQAELELAYQHRDGASLPSRRWHRGPLRVQKHFHPEGPDVCHHIIVHPPGGIAGGDHLRLDLDLGPDSHALLTSPGAAKWYRCQHTPAQQTLTARLAAGAVLEWLPQETILFSGARAELSAQLELAGDARLLWGDVVCLGRPAAGERFACGHWAQRSELWRDGQLIWHEQLWLDGDDPLLDAAAGLAGHGVAATLLWAGPELDEPAMTLARACCAEHGHAACTQLPGVWLARWLGDSAEAALAWQRALWTALRPHWLQRPAHAPRIWRT
jgi:urease accessory protein